ncbi:DUF3802 family protein [Psychrobium sp. 1_MG-2023]|uniref:DUF3802 family protein n=1 Tax=Psychrobium sp. 1_MG-2023 TaxID=3062624 RepID=UPI000C3300C5|nr:DUF3802 family protein [Psychrobium sp. 1_MG-2023]MDP2559626.1 DUF3802 family protein [Psychrobium sp. 1_MG-2023]PKF59459.1 DUF3802 domain-containing protein [Alteromonadales bacterium alter-6D02]
MVIQSDGYQSLIEYLTEHLSIFNPAEQQEKHATTVKMFIRYQMVEQMALLFKQHPELLPQEKIYIVAEFDTAFDDLSEVLGMHIEQQTTPSQQAFLTDYAGIFKNLFDAQLSPA